MPKGTNQKLKLYRLAQIMLENTDDEHYITMPEIMEELGKYEVTADRKTIYADLRDLSVLGIEVEGEPIGNRYHYRVVNRPFELPELKLLVDSIQSSKFITEKKTNTLIKKLEKLVSKYDAQRLQRQVYVSGRIKTMNEKNKQFRKDLLQCMKSSDILAIRDACLTGREKNESNVFAVIDCIVNKPWNKNKVTEYLLKLWNVPDTILNKEKDSTVIKNEIAASDEQFYELLDYQYYIKQRVLNNLNSDHLLERMLVHMPTGTGKTKTTMHIITNYINFSLKKKGIVIWIAHTTELLQQAYDTFESVWKHLGDGKINAYKLWGNKEIEDIDQSLDGIVFCGLAKIMSIADSNPKLYERLKKDCRLIVFDEAHKAAAKKTQKVIECLMRMPEGYENRALIGLTATPGRTTEDSYDNNLLTNMFGNKLIYIDSDILNQINMGKLKALNTVAESNIIKYFQERRILAKMEPHKLTYKMEFSESELKILSSTLRDMGYDDKEYTESQLKVLARNKERNLAILACLR